MVVHAVLRAGPALRSRIPTPHGADARVSDRAVRRIEVGCSAAECDQRLAAQRMQVRAIGRASSRSGPIGWPQTSHTP